MGAPDIASGALEVGDIRGLNDLKAARMIGVSPRSLERPWPHQSHELRNL